MKKHDILPSRLISAQSVNQSQQSIGNQNQTSSTAQVLSFSQERLWFLNQLKPNDPTNNRPFAWRLTGRLDIVILKKGNFNQHAAPRGTANSD